MFDLYDIHLLGLLGHGVAPLQQQTYIILFIAIVVRQRLEAQKKRVSKTHTECVRTYERKTKCLLVLYGINCWVEVI